MDDELTYEQLVVTNKALNDLVAQLSRQSLQAEADVAKLRNKILAIESAMGIFELEQRLEDKIKQVVREKLGELDIDDLLTNVSDWSRYFDVDEAVSDYLDNADITIRVR